MSITAQKKQELIAEYALSENDTGSVDVQCAVLTERIRNLTEHCKLHKHDHSNRLGLLKLVNTRKSLLKYLNNTKQTERYKALIARLGIRK
jgi:small subunit ribosomal protein S15